MQLKKGVSAESRLTPRKRGLLAPWHGGGLVLAGRSTAAKMLQAEELLGCWMYVVYSFV